MILKGKHQKHAKIARPQLGEYVRHEIGLLGAPCGMIAELVDQVGQRLADRYRTIYIDADHGSGEGQPVISQLTDMIGYHQWTDSSSWSDFDHKIRLSSYDLALVNGNHFHAKMQIPIIHSAKRDSLQRKLDRLDRIVAVIIDDVESPYEFISEHIGPETPILSINDVDAIVDLIASLAPPPVIRGLVLAGGQSQRMGTDKSQIDYHGLPQEQYMLEQLAPLCQSVSLSKRESVKDDLTVIGDTFSGLGPYGAILSAFRSDPDAAWLVTACDQPLLSTVHLERLVQQRDRTKVATCYHNPDTGFPEPLITLWEPRAYPRLLSFLALGYSCPRKVLINSDIQLLKVDDHSFMKNANTPEERDQLMQQK